jgi:hypothetical protein
MANNAQTNFKIRIPMMIGLIFLVLSLTGCSTTAKQGPTQWEYKVIQYFDQGTGPFYNSDPKVQNGGTYGPLIEDSINSSLQEEINKLGSEGWEMVSFTGDGQSVSTIMIFKREK